MSDLKTPTNKFLNRKALFEQKTNEERTKRFSGNTIRNMILSSRGDSLSNDELYNHYSEYRRHKYACLFSFALIPGATYFYTRSLKLTLFSLAPAYAVDCFLKWSLTVPSSNSFQFGHRSYMEFLKTALGMNLIQFATPLDKWEPGHGTIPMKEWIERNTYR
jgi:hypothetical protein